MMSLHVLIVHIFLSTSFLLICNAVEDTTINRAFRDIFKIPSAMCQNAEIEKQCNSMGATQRTYKKNGRWIKVPCTCHCKFNATYNVFGRFNNQWKCERNSAVRNYKLSECSLIRFKWRRMKSYLSTVKPNQNRRRKVGEIITNYRHCWTDGFFSYLDCKGSWTIIDGDPFHFIVNSTKLFIESRKYLDEYLYSSKIYGHIIKLGIKCTNDNIDTHTDIDDINYTSFCVVFKVRGQQKCSVIYPTTLTPTTAAKSSTSSKAQTTTYSSTRARPTTEKQKTTMSTTQASTTNYMTNIPLPPTKQVTTGATTRKPTLTNKTGQPQKHNKASTDTADDSGSIAGAIGGVTVLVAVLVILGLIIWFKRKRNSPNKRTADNQTVENPVYEGVVRRDNSSERPGQQTSEDDEYSYAYTNTHPVVIRDQNGTVLQGSNFSNGHNGNIKDSTGFPSSSEFPIYNTLGDSDYSELSKTEDTNSGPSYNVLERRPEANWNKKHSASGSSPNSEAPVYSKLEDPDYAKINKANETQSGPSYNVLERRPEANWNKQKGHLHDVLEKTNSASGSSPNSEDPIYNTPDYDKLEKSDVRIGPSYDILEGPEDKRTMAQLENPNSTGSTLYALLEEPELDEQHVYASLQNNDPHIYGALQSPTSHNGEANLEYDDDYNFAGEVIHDDVDRNVYQELNQDVQRSSVDVYEPLRHSRVLIDMKDMNEEVQSHA